MSFLPRWPPKTKKKSKSWCHQCLFKSQFASKPKTRPMANAQFFNAFAKPVYFLNTSRGKVVDTAALVAALDAGKLAGVGLDVFENEKLDTYTGAEKQQFEHLLKAPNVVLTPHIAGYSHEASIKMPQYVLEKLGILPNSRG